MKAVRLSWLLLLATATLACSDASGPNTPSVSGTWTYNASNVTGGGMTCNISSVVFILTQNGTTFTGTTTGGSMTCSAPGISPISSNLANDVIANGTINGNAVSFDIGTPDIHHTGTLSGNSLTGTVVIRIQTTTSGVVNLTGSFSAVKT